MCVLVWFCVENANGFNVQEAMMWFEMAASLVCSVLRIMELSVERLITLLHLGEVFSKVCITFYTSM